MKNESTIGFFFFFWYGNNTRIKKSLLLCVRLCKLTLGTNDLCRRSFLSFIKKNLYLSYDIVSLLLND